MRLFYLLPLVSFLAVTYVYASDDTFSRQVQSGDVLYTALASGATENEAFLLAEGRAVHLLSVECSVPPSDSRIFQQSTKNLGNSFSATVQIGVSIADCENTRQTSPARKGLVANVPLVEVQQWYDRKMALSGPSALVISSPKNIFREVTPYRFTTAQLAAAERAWTQRGLDRESLREQIEASIRR